MIRLLFVAAILAGLAACARPQPDIWSKVSRGTGTVLQGER